MVAGLGYVAFIVDVLSQRIVAWNASRSKATDLVMAPLRMAIWQRDHERNPVAAEQLIHHSDAGSQYTSIRFTEHLELEDIQPSIGSVGDAYDCEHPVCATTWGLTPAYDRPCGCPRVDVSVPGSGARQAAGRVGSDLIGA